MNNQPPLREDIPSTAWDNWFQQVFAALGGFGSSVGLTASLDFPSISAQSQASLTAAVKGAAIGATVLVAPASDVSGVIFAGVVTAKDVVTVYAKNFTAASIDPPSTSFRITVIKG